MFLAFSLVVVNKNWFKNKTIAVKYTYIRQNVCANSRKKRTICGEKRINKPQPSRYSLFSYLFLPTKMASVANCNHLNILQDDVLIQDQLDVWLGTPGETV